MAFLAHPHRHIFHFRVEVSVDHDNRDIEFIQLKRKLVKFVDLNGMDYKSCEMLAREIASFVYDEYSPDALLVSVAEDNENGAILEWSVK